MFFIMIANIEIINSNMITNKTVCKIHLISSFSVMKIYWCISCSICRCSIHVCCHICLYTICSTYNFVTHNHWIISDTCWTLAIFTSTCSRILNIFFACMFFLNSHENIFIPLLIWVTFFTIKLTFTFAWYVFC